MRHRRTCRAGDDIERILVETHQEFGTHQLEAYAGYIDRAIGMVADAPNRPSSKARPELGPETRSFHVALATGRKGGASHVLYYRVQDDGHGDAEVAILRVLPHRMEPRLSLAVDLDLTEDEDDTPQPGM